MDLAADIDEDSWYDFNKEVSVVANKSQIGNKSNISVEPELIEEENEDEFYNVFRSDAGLRRSSKAKWE